MSLASGHNIGCAWVRNCADPTQPTRSEEELCRCENAQDPRQGVEPK